MIKPLSPVAQAVLDAAYALPLKNGQPHLAAALRAAVDGVRRGPDHWKGSRPDDFDMGWEEALDWIEWVATELEA